MESAVAEMEGFAKYHTAAVFHIALIVNSGRDSHCLCETSYYPVLVYDPTHSSQRLVCISAQKAAGFSVSSIYVHGTCAPASR